MEDITLTFKTEYIENLQKFKKIASVLHLDVAINEEHKPSTITIGGIIFPLSLCLMCVYRKNCGYNTVMSMQKKEVLLIKCYINNYK